MDPTSEDPRLDRERDLVALRLVLRVRELLASKSSWTRGTLARDRHSHRVSPTSERAVRFCLSGALIRAAGEEFGFAVKLVKPSAPVTFKPPEPLVAAYRAAALAFFRLFVAGVEISDLPGEHGKIGLAKTVWREEDGTAHELADVRWLALVEAANDMDEVSFPLIRMTLLVAVARLAEAAGDPDAKGEAE